MKAITSAIEAAELMFGEVTSCYTAIGGTQIDSLNSRGLVLFQIEQRKPEINRMILIG